MSSSTWVCPFGSWSRQAGRAVTSLLKGMPPQARWKGSDSGERKASITRQQRSGCSGLLADHLPVRPAVGVPLRLPLGHLGHVPLRRVLLATRSEETSPVRAWRHGHPPGEEGVAQGEPLVALPEGVRRRRERPAPADSRATHCSRRGRRSGGSPPARPGCAACSGSGRRWRGTTASKLSWPAPADEGPLAGLGALLVLGQLGGVADQRVVGPAGVRVGHPAASSRFLL